VGMRVCADRCGAVRMRVCADRWGALGMRVCADRCGALRQPACKTPQVWEFLMITNPLLILAGCSEGDEHYRLYLDLLVSLEGHI